MPDGESEEFFAQGLDSPNQLEMFREISVFELPNQAGDSNLNTARGPKPTSEVPVNCISSTQAMPGVELEGGMRMRLQWMSSAAKYSPSCGHALVIPALRIESIRLVEIRRLFITDDI